MRRLTRLAPLVPALFFLAGCMRSELAAGEAGLPLGKVAPEIAGRDADGLPIKLSDFQGKVVLLDFSQTYCPPCRAMHTCERALVEQYKGRPFVVLEINCDRSLDVLRSSITQEKISWRIIWDGPGGPTFAVWEVQATPTIYLLDQKGVIRYKSKGPPPRKVLEQQIDQLLQETS